MDNYSYHSTVYDIYNFNFKYVQNNNSDFSIVNNQKININIVSKDILIKYLRGIGSSKAQNIINYREKMGGFYTVSEILNVNGIGENIFNEIKDCICV